MQEVNDFFIQRCEELELTCSICFDPFKDPQTLGCLHTFCKGHLDRMLEDDSKPDCPLCNKVFATGDCQADFRIKKQIEKIRKSCFEKPKTLPKSEVIEVAPPCLPSKSKVKEDQLSVIDKDMLDNSKKKFHTTSKHFKKFVKNIQSIELKDCRVDQTTKSRCGHVKAEGCELQVVQAQEDCIFIDTNATRVTSVGGSVRKTGDRICQFESILANQEIALEQAKVKESIILEETLIFAKKTSAKMAQAKQNINLIDCLIDKVSCTQGSTEINQGRYNEVYSHHDIEIKKANVAMAVKSKTGSVSLHDTVAGNAIARKSLHLEDSTVEKALCSMGKALVVGGKVSSLEARDDIEITECSVGSVTSNQGRIVATGFDERIEIGSLKSEKGMCLKRVKGRSATSESYPIEAERCRIKKIKSATGLSLKKSRAEDVVIFARRDGDDWVAEINMKKGKILGDIDVILPKEPPQAKSSPRITFDVSYSSCDVSYNGKELSNRANTIILGKFSYPFRSDEVSILNMFCRDLNIGIDGKIVSSNGKIVELDGKQIWPEPPKPVCRLYIRRAGTFNKDRVNFEGCDGKVMPDEGIEAT